MCVRRLGPNNQDYLESDDEKEEDPVINVGLVLTATGNGGGKSFKSAVQGRRVSPMSLA